MIKGYKCFNEDLTNRYGIKFEIGKKYETNDKKVRFGSMGSGFHLCKNIEDTLRYFDAMNENVVVCEVIGSGNFHLVDDEYNGFFDMYSVEKIEIVKSLSREEIINIALNLNEMRTFRFIQLYKLTKEEIELFKNKFCDSSRVLNAIEYYQKNNKKIYCLKK